ncbi:hypothetical protein ACIRVF_30450 [Kitasatospora sp. NPDC101157]|uniref:hypothetical protein n=1 Tax=Kitasatospora sp. NPDC101157 TaxID=3364098 RepID=UPI00380BCDA2
MATTVIRLVGMLPAGWACEPWVEGGRIGLRVEPGPGGAVDRWLAGVLADRVLAGWGAVQWGG